MSWNSCKRLIFGSLLAIFAVYSALVYTASPNLPQQLPMTEQARHGQRLYQEHNCVACHQFYGLGGYMGPDLTNTISTKGPMYAKAFLASGTSRMPDFNLTNEQIEALIGYLTFVDASGKYRVNEYKVYWNGAVVETGN
jgi:nitric oxide reductase subunit C